MSKPQTTLDKATQAVELKRFLIRKLEERGLPKFGEEYWDQISVSPKEIELNDEIDIMTLLEARIHNVVLQTYRTIGKLGGVQ